MPHWSVFCADRPARREVRPGTFRPHLTTLVALMHGYFRLTPRAVIALPADLFSLD
jgi:hypothetical protein